MYREPEEINFDFDEKNDCCNLVSVKFEFLGGVELLLMKITPYSNDLIPSLKRIKNDFGEIK